MGDSGGHVQSPHCQVQPLLSRHWRLWLVTNGYTTDVLWGSWRISSVDSISVCISLGKTKIDWKSQPHVIFCLHVKDIFSTKFSNIFVKCSQCAGTKNTRCMRLDFHNGMCVKLSCFSRKPLSHIILWSTKNDLCLMFSRSDKKSLWKPIQIF